MSLLTCQLNSAVVALKTNETLQELFLADNRLSPSDGIPLGKLLKYNHSLSLLDLCNNNLQVVSLCDCLIFNFDCVQTCLEIGMEESNEDIWFGENCRSTCGYKECCMVWIGLKKRQG